MGMVMAEASRAEVIHEVDEDEDELYFYEHDGGDNDNDNDTTNDHHQEATTTTTPEAAVTTTTTTTTASNNNTAKRRSNTCTRTRRTPVSSLTSAALEGLGRGGGGGGGENDHHPLLNNKKQQQQHTIISLGNSNDTNLKHIVRYFQSSCSSAGGASASASMTETTVSTPTTVGNSTATTLTTNKTFRQHPIRISFVPLDPNIALEDQQGGHFDLILHKLTEDILSCSLQEENDSNHNGNNNNNSAAKDRIQKLVDYPQRINPHCCLVDDPRKVQTIMSRSDISYVLQRCLQGVTSASGIPVQAPKFLVLEDTTTTTCSSSSEEEQSQSQQQPQQHTTTSSLPQRLQQAQLQVPLIVKPLIAAGTKHSHYMTIVLQDKAIHQIPPKSLIQEYVNHNATLYKVYVLGESIHVYQRPSLPNLPTTMTTSTVDLVEFDSQRPYPRLQDFGFDATTTTEEEEESARSSTTTTESSTTITTTTTTTTTTTSVTRDEVRPIVQALKQAFGLELFGFDILIHHDHAEEKEKWLVVDVNYFPSYKEVPNFPTLLAHYLTQRVLEQRKRIITEEQRQQQPQPRQPVEEEGLAPHQR
jgi:inositol-1,3,4-trisphosphate 5/6-kinase/inositol-tetrakisphosphate 1-kinase